MSEKLRSAETVDEAVLRVATVWAELRSKDPSSKVGAAIYHAPSGGLFLGYNGFPAGVEDHKQWWESRPIGLGLDDDRTLFKYDLVVHAEVNAAAKARAAGVAFSDCVLYVTHFPCSRCFRDVVCTSGIKRVVYRTPTYPSLTKHDEFVTRTLAGMLTIALERL